MGDDKAKRNATGRKGLRGPLTLFWPPLLALGFLALSADPAPITAALGMPAAGAEAQAVEKILLTAFWLTAAFAAQRWLRILVWAGIVEKRAGVAAPSLLVDLSAFLIYLAAVVVVLSFVFDLPVTGLLTTSSIVIAVIGFALRNMISDLFTGVAMGIDRPFRIGDWLRLDDGTVGRVAAMNWRATRLVTKEEISVVISNSELATNTFWNYSAPERFFRDSFTLLLDYSVTAWRAERLFAAAVRSVPEVNAVPREPEFRIIDFQESGILWEIRFWVPGYAESQRLRYAVQRAVLRNMHFSGVHVPGQKVEWRRLEREATPQDIDFLHAIDLLAPLTEAEIEAIDAQMTERLFRRGEPVVRQGEEGSSLFVVKEGILAAQVTDGEGRETKVGTLASGSFFGEMSLLTGAPRGATVVPESDALGFEITKDTLAPILERRPELAERLSETLAERQLRNRAAVAARDDPPETETRAGLARELLSSIRSFFGLTG